MSCSLSPSTRRRGMTVLGGAADHEAEQANIVDIEVLQRSRRIRRCGGCDQDTATGSSRAGRQGEV